MFRDIGVYPPENDLSEQVFQYLPPMNDFGTFTS
jgi:hypothetical protein